MRISVCCGVVRHSYIFWYIISVQKHHRGAVVIFLLPRIRYYYCTLPIFVYYAHYIGVPIYIPIYVVYKYYVYLYATRAAHTHMQRTLVKKSPIRPAERIYWTRSDNIWYKTEYLQRLRRRRRLCGDRGRNESMSFRWGFMDPRWRLPHSYTRIPLATAVHRVPISYTNARPVHRWRRRRRRRQALHTIGIFMIYSACDR